MRSILLLREKEGFTLIEVLVSLVILAIGLLMLATLQTISITGNKSSFGTSVASALGQQGLEQLMAMQAQGTVATDPGLTNGTHTKLTDPTLIPDQTVNGVVYSRTYTVNTNTPITGVMTVTMVVNWTVSGSVHSAALVGRI
jgi:type IV pilus assembly protein PilV